MRQHLVLTLILYLLVSQVIGQGMPAFQHIRRNQGLSNGSVTCMVQEKNGYFWIGTKNGLNRYDGMAFKVFGKRNSQLRSGDISDLLIDSRQRLWVATIGGGVGLYDPLVEDFVVFTHEEDRSESLPSNQIFDIFEDSEQRLWIGTENGLSLFDERTLTFKSYTHQRTNPYSLSHNSVRSIVEDDQGDLWIGTFGGGLNRFDRSKETFQHILPQEGQPEVSYKFIHTLFIENQQSILIGTNGQGLLKMDIKNLKVLSFFQKKDQKYQQAKIVKAIEKDDKGNLWVGTDGHGLFQITRKSNGTLEVSNFLNNAKLSSSLAGNAIYSIYKDDASNVWIGTAWDGISIIRNGKYDADLRLNTGLNSNSAPVLSVYKDQDHLWLGTDGQGITQLDLKNNKVINRNQVTAPKFPADYVQLIHKSNDGNFWLGSFANGLILCDSNLSVQKKYMHIASDPSSISFNDVRDILEDASGNFWIATWGGGLNYFNKQTEHFVSYRHDPQDHNSISSDNVLSLLDAGNGKIWIATFGGGLNLFDPQQETFTRFKASETENSISTNNLLSLLKDQEGNLWIGTWTFGLDKYDPKEQKFEHFDQEDINDNSITSLIEDDKGNLWMSTKRGIYKYDRSTHNIKSIGGLTFREFHINAAFRDSDGKLYFGGLDGLATIDPKEVEEPEPAPAVKLTGFKLFNEEVEAGPRQVLDKHVEYVDHFRLQYDQDVITFEFAALRFPTSETCEYAVKMDNFDRSWRMLGDQRSATFTNLSPGDYTFMVKARVSGGQWSEQVTAVGFTVLKPYWMTWWAFGMYGLVFCLLLYLFQKYTVSWEQMKSNLRFEKLTREKEKELAESKLKFFTDISHEIRTPVTLILGAINRMLEDGVTEKKNEQSAMVVRRNGGHLLQLVNELLDFRKLQSEGIQLRVMHQDFVSFVKEIFLSFDAKAKKNQMTYEFVTNTETAHIWFDSDQMEKVVYNLLSNAFKFTPKGGKIVVEISHIQEHVNLVIRDSGCGIAPSQINQIFKRFYQSGDAYKPEGGGFGIGLSISAEILKLHAAEISVDSKENDGSIFTVKLNCGKSHLGAGHINFVEEQESREEVYLSIDSSSKSGENVEPQKELTLLLVEDNTMLRAYLVELFSPHYSILEAADGEAAWAIVTDMLPDLVISDVMMPVMDGITFTRALKSDIRTSHIPVILLTARTSLVYKKEGFETGADEYVTKPFDEELLRTRVRNLLKGRELLRQRFKNEAITEPKELAISNPDQTFLSALMRVIEDNINENELKATFLTKELGISHSVIYKKVKALTGQSLVEFVRDFKLKRAAQLMTQQHYSVTDACYKVGFSDRRYFSKIFKKKFEMNPSEYIKNHFGT